MYRTGDATGEQTDPYLIAARLPLAVEVHWAGEIDGCI